MKHPCLRPTILLTASLLLQLSALCPQSYGAAGDVDLSFNPESGVNGTVRALVRQPDGKFIIGGEFTTVRGLWQPWLARLNEDGTGDPSFVPTGFSNAVETIALQPDGKVLVGFQVTLTECYEDWGCENYFASMLTRLNSDGSFDSAFSNATFTAYEGYGTGALLVQPDGRIIVGGRFTHVNGTEQGGIARMNANGTLDMTFQPGSGIGGYQAHILSLARQTDGKILVAGGFTTFAGTNVSGLARLNTNGNLDTTFNTGTNISGGYPSPYAVALQPDGKILIAGAFTNANGKCVARFHPDGNLDATFVPDLPIGTITSPYDSASAYAMTLQTDGKLIVAGTTTHFVGCDEMGGNCGPSTTTSFIVRLNANGSRDFAFTNSTANPAYWSTFNEMVLQPDGRVLIAGAFTEIDGARRKHIARLNTNGGLDEAFYSGQGLEWAVSKMALQTNGQVLVGGPLVEGTSYWQPAADIYPLVDGANQYGRARFNADGSSDRTFVSGANLNLNLPQFFNTEDCLDIPSSCDPSAVITTVIVQPDGKRLVVGYALTTVGTEVYLDEFYYPLFSRLNPDGSRDGSFMPPTNAFPSVILLQADGKIILGGNMTLGGTNTTVARLNANGTLDGSFTLGQGPSGVMSLALQSDGKILVGGNDTVLRLNANGSRDFTFNAAVLDGYVYAIAAQPDGKVIIGGSFTNANGTNRSRIARLNTDGSVDALFNPGTGPNNTVACIALQPDGEVIIGGSFTMVSGLDRPYMARLHGTEVAPGLNITHSNGLVTISWPLSAGFVLDQSLTTTGVWSQVAFPYSTNAGAISVSTITTTGNKFFRLRKP
jgi:uncharacterized delta-60 repeat protein